MPDPIYADDPLDLPILPGVSIGGIVVGQSGAEVTAWLGEPYRIKAGRGERTVLEYHGLTVWLLKSRVYMLVAETGYRGRTPSGIAVGCSWHELKKIHPNIQFDEEEGIWFSPGVQELIFDIVRPPRTEEVPCVGDWVDEENEVLDPDNAFVLSITVTSPETLTAAKY